MLKFGLKQDDKEKFISKLGKVLKVPEEKRDDFEFFLEFTSDEGVWNNNDFMFNVDTNSNCKYVSVFISDDKKDSNKFNIVVVSFSSTFKYAKNLMVI